MLTLTMLATLRASRHSITGYILILNGGAVSWQSVRQQVLVLSSAEAEYYTASVAGTNILYVLRLMDWEELGFTQTYLGG